jgi:hypothetical protein
MPTTKKGEKAMNEEQRIKLLEEELKILKNEVKTILLDIREQYLNIQNPFNFNMVANTPPPGASPDVKEKDLEIPEEMELPQDELQTPPAMESADLSFGKPFTDLSSNADLPGMGSMEDLPGAGPSGGPGAGPVAGFGAGPGAGPGPSAEAQPGAGVQDEEEPPQKPKSSRNKKKKEEEEMELEEDSDNDNDESEDEEPEEKPVIKMGSPKNGKKKSANRDIFAVGSRADLVIIAGLTQWVDQSTAKLGKERTEALVEMSTAMGRIPEKMKDVLIRMIRISRYETNGQTPTATDYLAILAQLESLISGSKMEDSALMSVLSMMKESGRG